VIPVKAIVFDFNGTLSDDEPILCGIFMNLFAEHGRPLSAQEYFDELAGLSDPEIVLTWLGRGHPSVEAVHYPGLESHAGHDIAARQMSAFGGMLSFNVRGGRAEALAVTAKTKVFTRATSLGGMESLIEHRNSSEGPGSRTAENLLRVSVGLEHSSDLVEDLMAALG
jgi:cystathionine beta-lyase/cystathionine gamma-synthase